jgi:hypothetical protein
VGNFLKGLRRGVRAVPPRNEAFVQLAKLQGIRGKKVTNVFCHLFICKDFRSCSLDKNLKRGQNCSVTFFTCSDFIREALDKEIFQFFLPEENLSLTFYLDIPPGLFE